MTTVLFQDPRVGVARFRAYMMPPRNRRLSPVRRAIRLVRTNPLAGFLAAFVATCALALSILSIL